MVMSSIRQTIQTRSIDSAWLSRNVSELVPRVDVECNPLLPSRLTVVLSSKRVKWNPLLSKLPRTGIPWG